MQRDVMSVSNSQVDYNGYARDNRQSHSIVINTHIGFTKCVDNKTLNRRHFHHMHDGNSARTLKKR